MIVALIIDISAASAQQAGRVYKIGFPWTGEPGLHLRLEEFKDGNFLAFGKA
jgi:hypothetical protein